MNNSISRRFFNEFHLLEGLIKFEKVSYVCFVLGKYVKSLWVARQHRVRNFLISQSNEVLPFEIKAIYSAVGYTIKLCKFFTV